MPSINTKALLNLPLFDPPKWGWSAAGGIFDLLAPIERARRKESRDRFLQTKAHFERENNSGASVAVGSTNEVDNLKPLEKNLSTSTLSQSERNDEESKNNECPGENGIEKMSNKPNNTKKQVLSNSYVESSTNSVGVEADQYLQVKEENTVELYSYHRGRVGEEPRDKKTGKLLCDVDELDTNYHWDPSPIIQINIHFPLCDPDDMKSERIDSSKIEGKEESNTDDLDYYDETIQWDLQDATTPCPMTFAGLMAEEYGLTYGQTIDLANSIQRQIDAFLKKNKYDPPMTLTDPFGTKRPTVIAKGVTSPKPTRRNMQNSDVKTPSSSKSRTTAQRSRGHTYVSRKEDRDELLRRSKAEFRAQQAANAKQNNTEVKRYPELVYDRFCHICHGKREVGIAFSCGVSNHVYCNYHCENRLGFSCQDIADKKCTFDYCPCCCLTCPCAKCARLLDKAANDFKLACETQNKSAAECEYEALKVCTGTKKIDLFNQILPAGTKNQNVSTRGLKRSNSKNDIKTSKRRIVGSGLIEQKPSHSKRQNTSYKQSATFTQTNVLSEKKSMYKVPISCLPHETFDGIDLDPSSKDDYKTVFGPNGSQCVISDDKDMTEDDPNMNHCFVCDKGGDLVCCDICPRSYHRKCLKDNRKSFPDNWICHNCVHDSKIQPDDHIKDVDDSLRSIIPAFAFIEANPSITPNQTTVAKIHKILTSLIESEFGYMFQEPVDVKKISDYLSVVSDPMDLGTISKNLINGAYFNKDRSNEKEKTTEQIFEEVVLKALKDIELVWHNCFLYNADGSYCHRMGKLLCHKYRKYRKCNIDADLNEKSKLELEKAITQYSMIRKEYYRKFSPSSVSANEIVDDEYCHIIENPPSRSGTGKYVAVFDPDTGKVVKIYTTQKAAGLALSYLNTRFDCELGELSEYGRKNLIKKCAENPFLRCFGYRWVDFEDLKKGGVVNFESQNSKGASNPNICQSENSIDELTLDEFIERTSDDNKRTIYKSLSHAYQSIVANNSPNQLDFDGFREQIYAHGVNKFVLISPFRWRWVKKSSKEEKAQITTTASSRCGNKLDNILSRTGKVESKIFTNTFNLGRMKENGLIFKQDMISAAVLRSFKTIEEAYNDFADTRCSQYWPDSTVDDIKIFEKYYVNGDSNVDGIRWVYNTQLHAESVSTKQFHEKNTRLESSPDSAQNSSPSLEKPSIIANNLERCSKLDASGVSVKHTSKEPPVYDNTSSTKNEKKRPLQLAMIQNEYIETNQSKMQEKHLVRSNLNLSSSEKNYLGNTVSFKCVTHSKKQESNEKGSNNIHGVGVDEKFLNKPAEKDLSKIYPNKQGEKSTIGTIQSTIESSKSNKAQIRDGDEDLSDEVVAISLPSTKIIGNFQSLRAASMYANLSEPVLAKKIKEGTVVDNKIIYARSTDKEDVIKRLHNAISETLLHPM